MRGRIVVGLVAVALALAGAVAATAGSSFVARANAICGQTAARVYTLPAPETGAQALNELRTAAGLFNRLVKQVGALQPPQAIAARVAAMLDAFHATATGLKQARTAALAGESPDAALARAKSSEQRAQGLAYRLGLGACAGDFMPGTKVFRMPSSSMEPTLHCARPGPGCEARVADRMRTRALRPAEPRRFDILVFDTPPAAAEKCGEGGRFVKRVIGLPGETVKETNGHVSVDGKRLDEPYVKFADSQTGTWRVPRGEYFVLGDNRAQSCDSRQWGSAPRKNVVGKVIEVLRGSKTIPVK